MLPTELTFIILARTDVTTDIRNCDEWRPSDESMPSREEIDSFPMIGDVNLFLKGIPSDEDFEAEVEIMRNQLDEQKIEVEKERTLHLVFLLQAQWLASCQLEQLGIRHPIMVFLTVEGTVSIE